MPYSNKTANLELPQWAASDEPVRTDFNEAYLKIDTEIKTNTDAALTNATEITKIKNGTTVIPKAVTPFLIVYQVPSLNAGESYYKPIYVFNGGATLQLTRGTIIAHGDATGIDNENTCTLSINGDFGLDEERYKEVFNSTNTFPTSQNARSLSEISTVPITNLGRIMISIANVGTASTPDLVFQIEGTLTPT